MLLQLQCQLVRLPTRHDRRLEAVAVKVIAVGYVPLHQQLIAIDTRGDTASALEGGGQLVPVFCGETWR